MQLPKIPGTNIRRTPFRPRSSSISPETPGMHFYPESSGARRVTLAGQWIGRMSSPSHWKRFRRSCTCVGIDPSHSKVLGFLKIRLRCISPLSHWVHAPLLNWNWHKSPLVVSRGPASTLLACAELHAACSAENETFCFPLLIGSLKF